ncbi:MAG: hypothetical protein ACI956_002079 [Nonlabens sp.]|jgi:hypothetical protein
MAKTRKHLFLTLITAFGVEQNEPSLGFIDQVLTIDDLFDLPKPLISTHSK